MKQCSLKSVAFQFCVCMLLSILPITAFAAVDYAEGEDDYYNVISKDDYELAPGISESEIVLNNNNGTHRQVAHVVEVDLSNPYTKVIPSYKGMAEGLNAENYGVQIMSEQAAYAEANGYGNVVAAMNLSLSWYDSDYYVEHPELVGEPLGYMILDGLQYTNSQGQTSGAQTCVVINYDEKDGVARPADIPKVEIRATSSAITGWEEQVIPANFGFLVKDGVNQYREDNNSANGASRSFVGIKEDGTFVMVMNDGRQSPYSAGFTNYEMAEFMLSLGCVQAVNGDGGGSSAFLSQRPGEELELNCSPSDGAERPTTHGILVISTAPADGQFARANITVKHDYYTPGSTVTFSALGTDLVGTTAEIPENVTWQLADPSMGTIEDGIFVSNGTVGTVTAQMVWNGSVVGEASVEIVIPETLTFSQSVMTVPFNKEVTIGLTATINGGLHEVVLKPEDVVLVADNELLGTFNGFSFTSVSTENAPEDLSATLTATLVYDDSLVATATLSLGKGSEVLFDFEEGIDGWVSGEVNGNTTGLVYDITAANSIDGQVHDGNGSLRLNYNGLSALNVSSGGYAQVDLYLEDAIIVENATSIGFWAYIPDEYEHCWIRVLYWYDPDGDGIYDKKNTISVINQPTIYNTADEDGWYYFSFDVSAYKSVMIAGVNDSNLISYNASKNDANNFRFIEFMFPHTNTNDLWKTYGTINGEYTIYVDNIIADYSGAVDDREAPVFGEVNLTENDTATALKKNSIVTTRSNELNVSAAVAENTAKTNATGLDTTSARAYVDGVAVDVTYSNGKMSINDVVVADGVHRVKFEICDMMGNKSVVIRLINVISGVDASTIQVVPHDASLDRLYGGSLYWMDLNATDIETIQSITTVIDINSVNHWELDHMELAEGFVASYILDEETNTAKITITRTGMNTQAGAATLASLPIRIVYYDTDINIEGYTAENYWTSYDFWPQDLKVDVDMGQITYVEGYTSDVLNTFSNEEFSVDAETYTVPSAMDEAFKAERGTAHVHIAEAMEDAVVTCTKDGYTGRTYCSVCDSVVDWGTTVQATGHDYKSVDGILMCVNACGEKFSGELEGKIYIDGVVADGWVNDTYYYIDGTLIVGQYYMDGNLYTFGDDGVYKPDYLYTGFYQTADGKMMYFVSNEYLTGYHYLAGEPYFFDEDGLGFDGEYTLCGETCIFENGQYVQCTTADVLNAGMAGPKAEYVIYSNGTMKLDGTGETYSFTNHGTRPFIGYNYKITTLEIGRNITRIGTYFCSYSSINTIVFAENCNLKQIGSMAFYECWGVKTVELPRSVTYISNKAFGKCSNLSKIVIPESVASIHKATFKDSDNVTMYVIDESYALQYAKDYSIPYEIVTADSPEDPVIVGEIVEEDGVLHYFENGVRTYAGLIYLDGNYYYVRSNCQVVANSSYWITKTNNLLPAGKYTFDAEGKMVDVPSSDPVNPEEPTGKKEIVNEDGVLYYYEDGVRTYAGLIYLDGNYYYVRSNCQLVVSSNYWITKTNDLLPSGSYTFDVEGKMVNAPSPEPEDPDDTEVKKEIVNENGTLYYYEDGVRTYGGLIYLDGDYYYVRSNCQIVVNSTYWVTKTNNLLPAGNYTFGADGKMITE